MYPYPAYPPAVPYGTPAAPAMTKQQEMDVLKDQAEYLENSLDEIRKRLNELESEAGKQ
jgi:predicted  nucleic acid-binding Zn-ribbon protein